MKICVITPVYAIAGVPLAQIRFARALAAKGHDVDLVVGHVPRHLTMPNVSEVNVLVWRTSHVRRMLVPLCRYLRTTKPDVVFSAEDHLNAVVLLAAILSNTKAKVSGSSRVLPSDPQAYSTTIWSKGRLLRWIMKAVMWRADALTCVSREMVDHYRTMFSASRHVYVYNIVRTAAALIEMHEPVDHQWLEDKTMPVVITAGTLTARKGFADLIRAFAAVRTVRPVRLIVLGDGPLRGELEALVVSLGLSEVVSMPGNIDNPLRYFRLADVFVLSSYAEGMPNVLVEAMMCGCTPVATDCPTGPRELLESGKYGYLVPMGEPEAMARAIVDALDKPVPMSLLDEATGPFTEEAVLDKHFNVLGLNDL